MTTGGNPMKKLSLSLAAVVAIWSFLLISCSAPIAPINVGADGVALKGYDPVAYFTQGQPVKGQNEYQLEWNNAKWLFASSEHLALFQDDPAKYAPQYGGY
jgi:YHS domain-containing protein